MNDLINVIQAYQKEIHDGLEAFERQIGRRDLIRAWREGLLEKSGALIDGTKYEFHGIGCCLSFNDHEVDFDFSSDSRPDGFDLWRLWRYAKQFPDRFSRYQNKSEVQKDFNELIAASMVVRLFSTESTLYFLADHKQNFQVKRTS